MNKGSLGAMMPLLLAVIVILAVAMLLMCVRVICKKDGRFSQGHACRMGSTPLPLPKTKTKTKQHKS